MTTMLDPTDERVPVKRQLTPRPETLTGRVAFLDISKPRGNVLIDRLEALISAMPVVLVSRAGNGEVLRGTYGGFAGSETDLIARGVIFGGALDGPKARVLLTLLLMRGASRTEIQNVFETIGPRCGPPSPN